MTEKQNEYGDNKMQKNSTNNRYITISTIP